MPKDAKVYAPRIPPSAWERHRCRIRTLFVDQNKTLSKVAEMMKSYGLYASESQYEHQLKIWGIRKNLKRTDWCRIARDLEDRLADGRKGFVFIDGKLQPDEKLAREIARSKHISCKGLAPGLPSGVEIVRLASRVMHICRRILDASRRYAYMTRTGAALALLKLAAELTFSVTSQSVGIYTHGSEDVCLSTAHDDAYSFPPMKPWSTSMWESVGVTSEEWVSRGWNVLFGGWG